MRTLLPLVMLAMTVSVEAGRVRTVDLGLRPGEFIGAAQVLDDGSAVLAVASQSPRQSRLVRIGLSGQAESVPVDGVAINHLQLVGPERYFVGGATANGYAHRLIGVSGGRESVLWDSTSLPASLRQGEYILRVDAAAKRWGSAVVRGDTLAFSWGTIGAARPAATMTIESKVTGRFPPRFVFDATDIVFRGQDAAVLWQGRVYLADLATARVDEVLSPSSGGAELHYDTTTGTIWVGGNEWVAYDLRTPRSGAQRRAERTVAADRAGWSAVLSGGRIAQLDRDGMRSVTILDARGRTESTLRLPNATQFSVVRVSETGRAILVEPEGPRGSTVEIHVRD